MGKKREDANKAFPLQCREGKDTDERCLLRGTYTSSMTGGPAWCPYHAAIHRDRWPRDKAAFFEWIEYQRTTYSLVTMLPGLNVRYNAEEVWEAACGRKALPALSDEARDAARDERGIRSRELVALVVGDWADGPFRGAGRGILQKVLDREMTGAQAVEAIEKAAAKIRATTEAEAFE